MAELNDKLEAKPGTIILRLHNVCTESIYPRKLPLTTYGKNTGNPPVLNFLMVASNWTVYVEVSSTFLTLLSLAVSKPYFVFHGLPSVAYLVRVLYYSQYVNDSMYHQLSPLST